MHPIKVKIFHDRTHQYILYRLLTGSSTRHEDMTFQIKYLFLKSLPKRRFIQTDKAILLVPLVCAGIFSLMLWCWLVIEPHSVFSRLPKERILSIEGGSSRSHYVETSLRKRLWTYRKTDY